MGRDKVGARSTNKPDEMSTNPRTQPPPKAAAPAAQARPTRAGQGQPKLTARKTTNKHPPPAPTAAPPVAHRPANVETRNSAAIHVTARTLVQKLEKQHEQMTNELLNASKRQFEMKDASGKQWSASFGAAMQDQAKQIQKLTLENKRLTLEKQNLTAIVEKQNLAAEIAAMEKEAERTANRRSVTQSMTDATRRPPASVQQSVQQTRQSTETVPVQQGQVATETRSVQTQPTFGVEVCPEARFDRQMRQNTETVPVQQVQVAADPSPAERVQIQPSFGVEVCPEARHNPPIAESPVSTQNNPTQQPDHFTTPVRKRSQPDTVVLEYKKSDPVVSLSLESKKACEDRSVFLERLPKDKKDAVHTEVLPDLKAIGYTRYIVADNEVLYEHSLGDRFCLMCKNFLKSSTAQITYVPVAIQTLSTTLPDYLKNGEIKFNKSEVPKFERIMADATAALISGPTAKRPSANRSI